MCRPTAALSADCGTLTNLGSLGGNGAFATGINVFRTESSTAAGTSQAFIWSQATGMQDLSTMGFQSFIPTGINSAGQIVGKSSLTDGGGAR